MSNATKLLPAEIVPPEWWVVIETNSYSGNFHQQLAAWCTGNTADDYGASQKEAEDFLQLGKPIDVAHGDVNGFAQMWHSGAEPRAVGIGLPTRPSRSLLKSILNRAQTYANTARAQNFPNTFQSATRAPHDLQILGMRVVRTRLSVQTVSKVGIPKTKKAKNVK